MNLILSNSSDQPIYAQIAAQLKNSMMQGELGENQMLPSIRTLAKELSISVITTKRAYEELERDGYIVSVPGKGFYIAAQNRELMRESRMKIVEERLAEAVDAAKTIGLSYDEMLEMLKIFYEE